MTRNQKIALGCGGAGCLGLIVVAIACGVVYYLYSRQSVRYERATRAYNFNVNTNSNSNSNDNANDNAPNVNASSNSSSVTSMSEDDKHKLYQAASMTGDTAVLKRVSIQLRIFDEDGLPVEGYQRFMAQHAAWAIQNLDFIREISTPEKAKAYVDEHLE